METSKTRGAALFALDLQNNTQFKKMKSSTVTFRLIENVIALNLNTFESYGFEPKGYAETYGEVK